jgi:hypothetical protein
MKQQSAGTPSATSTPDEPLTKIAALLTEDVATGAGSLAHLIVDSPADGDATEFLASVILVGSTVPYAGYGTEREPAVLTALNAAAEVILALDVVDGDEWGGDGATYANVVALEGTLVALEGAVDAYREALLAGKVAA